MQSLFSQDPPKNRSTKEGDLLSPLEAPRRERNGLSAMRKRGGAGVDLCTRMKRAMVIMVILRSNACIGLPTARQEPKVEGNARQIDFGGEGAGKRTGPDRGPIRRVIDPWWFSVLRRA